MINATKYSVGNIMMQQKILFLDLDGTLLDDRKEITAGNRAALDRALAMGHRVVIATGRPTVSGLKQSHRLGLDTPGCYLIAFNGGQIYDFAAERLLCSYALPTAVALGLIELCRRKQLHVQSYDDRDVLVEKENDDEWVRFYCSRIEMSYRVVPSFEEALHADPPKVLVIAHRENLVPLYDQLREKYSAEVDFFYSTKELLEIVPKGVNKGAAVRRLCERLSIPLENSIAVGDEENDLSMVQTAGVGVAMANGIARLKQAANYVTTNDNNHDGIAEVVEKFML